jgi:xylose dehydrogenase (NAD/NADP)
MRERPLRLGLLSTARINGAILRGAAATDRVEVVAVASRDGARAEAYAREHAIERAHGSYEELLADDGVDAVYISLPNSLHVPWSIHCLDAGKHVLCEKPLSRDPAEVGRAFDAAERSDRVLTEGFMYRAHPQTARLATLVDEGAIGRIRAAVAGFTFPLGDVEDIRASRELAGGSLMDVGCYCVSGLRLLLGEPERVAGEEVLGLGGVDEAFHGTLRFAGDVVAQFVSSFALPIHQRLELLGEEGSILVEAPWRTDWGGDLVVRRGGDVRRTAVERVDAYALELEKLAAGAEGRFDLASLRADAVGQARTLDALYRSAAGGAAVRV